MTLSGPESEPTEARAAGVEHVKQNGQLERLHEERISNPEAPVVLPEDRRISRFGRFANFEVERAYRARTLNGDRGIALVSMVVAVVLMLLFGVADTALLGEGKRLTTVLVLRGGIVVLTIATLFVLRRASSETYDRWLFTWSLLLCANVLVIDQTRPPDYVLHLIMDSVVLLAVYLIFITRFSLQLVVGTFFSLVLTAIVLGKSIPAVGKTSVLISFGFLNVFAALLSWRFHIGNRKQFASRTAERELRSELEQLAFTDSLTGIPNRRDFMMRGANEFERFRRHERPFSLLILDLDRFKQINDRYGHDVGDRVLADFGQLLADECRTNDVPARLGGEEFAVLLPDTDLERAEAFASRLMRKTRELRWDSHRSLALSVSIGATRARIADHSLDDIIRRADRALYAAKERGRDRAISAPA